MYILENVEGNFSFSYDAFYIILKIVFSHQTDIKSVNIFLRK